MLIPDFKPGDLIDANQLKAYFTDIERRLAELEKKDEIRQGQVVVSALIPPKEVRVGELLRILGLNFYQDIRAAHVFLNDQELTIINSASSNTELQVRIPPRATIGPATLVVSNAFSSTVPPLTINILRTLQPLTGSPSLTFLRAEPPDTTIDLSRTARYTFLYTLSTMDMSEEATYQIIPDISVVEWSDSLRLVDENGDEIPEPITLKPRETAIIGMFMKLSPFNPLPTDFTPLFKIEAENKNRSWTLGDRKFTDGEVVGEEGAIELAAPTFAFVAGSNGEFVDETNTITSDQTFDLTIPVNFTKDGTYTPILIGTGQDEGIALEDRGWQIARGAFAAEVVVTEESRRQGGGTHPAIIALTFVADGDEDRIDFELGYSLDDKKTVVSFHLHHLQPA